MRRSVSVSMSLFIFARRQKERSGRNLFLLVLGGRKAVTDFPDETASACTGKQFSYRWRIV